jgi:hypothetical protein
MRTTVFKWRYQEERHGLLPLGPGVQFVGGVEGAVEVKTGTFLTFKARKPVLLVVPNRVAPSLLLLSHRVSKGQRHEMSSLRLPSWVALQRSQILVSVLGKDGETVAVYAIWRMLDAHYGRRNRAVKSSLFIGRHCIGVQGKACNAAAAVGLDREFVKVFLQGVLCAHSRRTSRVAG